MTGRDHLYTDRDLEDVLNNPEWTAEDIAKAKRIDDVDPELAANIRRALPSPMRPSQRLPMRPPLRKPTR
jgi:hypothetical protein